MLVQFGFWTLVPWAFTYRNYVLILKMFMTLFRHLYAIEKTFGTAECLGSRERRVLTVGIFVFITARNGRTHQFMLVIWWDCRRVDFLLFWIHSHLIWTCLSEITLLNLMQLLLWIRTEEGFVVARLHIRWTTWLVQFVHFLRAIRIFWIQSVNERRRNLIRSVALVILIHLIVFLFSTSTDG